MITKRALLQLAILTYLVGAAVAEIDKADKPPADMPDLTESSKLPARMPKVVSGIVYVDKNANGKCDSGEAA
ncbi:MAG: hypothetical protein QGG25_19200, partial [Phycisphaerae bacterium]|nr:hypothetical protein [Phycisphaerae bacterium]